MSSDKDHYCQFHPDTLWEWHKNFRGKNVMGCPVCSGVRQKEAGPLKSAMVKFSPTFWRERPLSDKEKQYPPRKGS